MVIFFRVLKHLGCPHGCNDGQRGPPAEFLRTQSQNILSKLNRASSKQFSTYFKDYINFHTLTEVLDFFHAYCGFCVDPSSLLSPLSKFRWFQYVQCFLVSDYARVECLLLLLFIIIIIIGKLTGSYNL